MLKTFLVLNNTQILILIFKILMIINNNNNNQILKFHLKLTLIKIINQMIFIIHN